ncbi:MAG: DUF1570 domain-containing protein [Planctomycetota bacterium]
MPRARCLRIGLGICLLFCGAPLAAPGADFMVALTLGQQQIEGMPLAWDAGQVHLLARDGRLWSFRPDEAREYRQTDTRFVPYLPSQLRAEMLRDLGRDFEVTGTSHYMIAHAATERDKWANRFEELYRSFVHYFSVRGFQLEKPRFPLLGVVCRNQAEFMRYSAKQGLPASAGVLGWYDSETNRILIYDMGGAPDSAHWQENAAVIIHEAAHQSAFNTGVHSRMVLPPVWLAEGLATMFEAPGVYDSRNHQERGDRINRGRLSDFRSGVRAKHKPDVIKNLVVNDTMFQQRPSAAYAEAWALTFFLVETEPRKYAQYVARTASRPPLSDYTPKQRLDDFTAIYGSDWPMLEARFLRFIDGLE